MKDLQEGLRQYLGSLRGGFYVECGANDGLSGSNTLRLEKELGWTGILVEPSPGAYQQCVANRGAKNKVYNCALVSNTFDGPYIRGDFDGSLMSSVGGERRNNTGNLIDVPAKTLTSLLLETNVSCVDFFSLDVEGYELEVLNGLDFQKYKPTYVLIEVYNRDFERICLFMGQRNYILVDNLSGFNKIDDPGWDGTHNDYLFKQP